MLWIWSTHSEKVNTVKKWSENVSFYLWRLCLRISDYQDLKFSMQFRRRRQWHPTPVLLPGNLMDGGAWWATVHGVAKSQTGLSNFIFIFTFMHRRRKCQPTPLCLPGESQGQGSLVGCRLWGRTESDTTEAT